MAAASLLSLFGPPGASFLVPAKDKSAVARRRGQGRPVGRRAKRASLDGAEHGRTLLDTGTLRRWAGFTARTLVRAGLAFWLSLVAGTSPLAAEPAPGAVAIGELVDMAAARFQLPPIWIHAVIDAESGGDPRAVSPRGAMGMMQLMPATWRALSAQYRLGEDPFDRRANVLAGAAYLRQLVDQYGREGFLAAYNAGPNRYAQARAGGRPLPAETVAYVARVERSIAAAGEVGGAVSVRPAAADWRAAGLFVGAGAEGDAMAVTGLFARPNDRVAP